MAIAPQSNGDAPLFSLVKELVDNTGALFASHVKLARVELAADVQSYARRAALGGLAAALVLLGYALACIAGALALGRVIDPPLAFAAIGGAHLLGGGIAFAVLSKREAAPPLGETLTALDRTVSTLASPDPGLARARLVAARLRGKEGRA
jgi:Putative Actinobacterial Holin-X, holin superfamily III